MASAAVSSPVLSSSVFIPEGSNKHIIHGEFTLRASDGSAKTYTITPISNETREEAEVFLGTFQNEFHRNGAPYPADKVAKRVDTLIQRFIDGKPWSAYLVKDTTNNTIAGWWTIGYHDVDGHLQSDLMVKEEYQHEHVSEGIWDFTTCHLIPSLNEQKIPVDIQPELDKSNLYITAHPDNMRMNSFLESCGFEVESTSYEPAYENKGPDGAMIHDGRRNLWKISVERILEISASALKGCSFTS